MRTWSENWDLTSIPDELFRSEHGRRCNALRKNPSGGVVWAKHRPGYSRCRCAVCIKKRAIKAEKAPPKRPRGRPRKEVAA